MRLEVLPMGFTVCKIDDVAKADLCWPFCFLSLTDVEKSLVCPTDNAPAETLAREDGWRALRVAGSMEFSLVGVLAGLTGTLRDKEIPVFAISTFDTDYLLAKSERFPEALAALEAAGHTVIHLPGEIRKNR